MTEHHPDIQDLQLEQIRAQRLTSTSRHAEALTALLAKRGDLKGVHALADLVDDHVKWSA